VFASTLEAEALTQHEEAEKTHQQDQRDDD